MVSLPSVDDSITSSIDKFCDANILCVGDVMLDRFIYGTVDRISPEAPIPVVKYEREELMLGGAGNVIRNISSLGGSASFISVVGNDDISNSIVSLVATQKNIFPYILHDNTRRSTEKTRYIAGSQHLFRMDKETVRPNSRFIEEQIIDIFCDELPKHQLVVLSDYNKGILTPNALRKMIDTARENDIPVIIDPKSRDFSIYSGATIVTPNIKELEAASRDMLFTDSDPPQNKEERNKIITDTARALLNSNEIEYMLVTLGADGMILVGRKEQEEGYYIPARARDVFDVSGAGDTVVATLAVAVASGCSYERAAFIANIAAGIVVSKMGTAAVHRTDLKSTIYTLNATAGQAKLFPRDIAISQIESWKREGAKVGFTNGCFDIVHSGHLSLIKDAKSHCDKLVVAINSDESVKRLKGESRPINNEIDRAMLLAELSAVDLVVIFREDTPEELLKLIRPDILMKGADYEKHEIVGADFVESYGGKVIRIKLKEGYSTTGTINKIMSS